MKSRKINWGWLAAESLVIVSSILLAFWIEASWGKRLENREEHEILIGVEKQFETFQANLEYMAILYDSLCRKAGRLLNESSAENLSISDIESGLGSLLWAGTLDTGTGTLEAMLSSGRLELIKNVELRTYLSQWNAILEETQDNETGMRDYVYNVLVPAMAALGVETTNLFPYHDNKPYYIFNDPDIHSYQLLLTNPRFKSLAQYRFRWLSNSLNEFNGTVQDCKVIPETIWTELDKR